MSERYANEEAWLRALMNVESEDMDMTTSSEEEGENNSHRNKEGEPDQMEGSYEIVNEENPGYEHNYSHPNAIISSTVINQIKQTLDQIKHFQLEKWYHFDEGRMSWLPVSSSLQQKFEMEYVRVRDNPSLRASSPHFTFEMNGSLYGVRIDFSPDRKCPYGEQFKLDNRGISRTIIKAVPDSSYCINGLPVVDC